MNREKIKLILTFIIQILHIVVIRAKYRSIIISKVLLIYLRRAGIVFGREAVKLAQAFGRKFVELLRLLNRNIICFSVRTRYKTIRLVYSLATLTKAYSKQLILKIIKNRKKVAIGALTACAFAFCAVTIFNAVTAYEFSYKGKILCVVDQTESIYAGIEEAEKTLTEEKGVQVVLDEEENIDIKMVLKNTDTVSKEEDVVNALTAIDDINVLSYAVTIRDAGGDETDLSKNQILYLDTEEHAEEVLDCVKSEFTKDIDPAKFVDATFEEDVKIEKIKTQLEDIVDTPAALKTIMTGGIEEKTYLVEIGDSVADIASKFGISREKLKKWNPQIGDDNMLYLNEEIQLQERIPLINVITKRNTMITEDFNAEIEYQDTKKLYKGQEIVLKKGKSGNRTVNTDIIEKNGVQIDRIDHSSIIHKEPKTKVVMRGTKKRPDTIGKGYYYYPINGNFSSPFGSRWGRIHEGIDLTASTGTNVYAADAGVVVEAGATSNGYGIAVRISHGKGRTTYYAHNSQVLVKVGETVYRGQNIAKSGSTGSSSGPHLHFETRFNGVPKDPTKYL